MRQRFPVIETTSITLVEKAREDVMKEERISDVGLVDQFKEGDVAAFEEIITRYESKVMNLALRFTRNQEDAEEVMQDVFTTVYRKIDGFRGQSAFSSWLYRIVVNAAFMKLRKKKQNQTVSMEDLAPAVKQYCMERDSITAKQSYNIAVSRELQEVLQRAIDKLPDQYRAVFVLRDVDGLSNQETGQILDLSIPAVKSRLHRSRIMLRKRLQRYYEDFTGNKAIIEELNDDGNDQEVAA
jgi:RNA polymerase sigma-70 factor (ECF subfamily)